MSTDPSDDHPEKQAAKPQAQPISPIPAPSPNLPKLIALSIIAACVFTLSWRSATAKSPAPNRTLTETERRAIGRDLAKREPDMRNAARLHFPGDHWSADDDFHNAELRNARGLATKLGVSVGEILRSIDEDIRNPASQNPGRQHNAHPCKPRPFYD